MLLNIKAWVFGASFGMIFGVSLPVDAQTESEAQGRESFRTKHFTTVDGLPGNRLESIAEDSLGFLWIGSWQQPLARYDGYSFETFAPQSGDSTSIGGVNIVTLHVDAEGFVWSGGGHAGPGGFSRFDPRTGQFRRYRQDAANGVNFRVVTSITSRPTEPGVIWIGWEGDSAEMGGVSRFEVGDKSREVKDRFTHYTTRDGLASAQVMALYFDSKGVLWAGTEGGELHRFDAATGRFEAFLPFVEETAAGVLDISYAIYEAPSEPGVLWIGWAGGLVRMDPTATGSQYSNRFSRHGPEHNVNAVLEDRSGALWIGTNDGLYTFDRLTGEFIRFPNQPQKGWVASLYEDRFGVLWVLYDGDGLLKIERWTNPFTIYKQDPHDPMGLLSNQILSVVEDQSGVLWIGSEGGLDRVDRADRTVMAFPNLPFASRSFADRSGVLWATRPNCSGVLIRMEVDAPGRLTQYIHDPDDLSSIGDGCINTPMEDRAGNFWIQVWDSGIDRLVLLEPEDNLEASFLHYTPTSHGLGDAGVLWLYEAPSEPGILWVGTESGLSRLDTKGLDTDSTKSFVNYHDLALSRSMMMHEDRQGRFWVATAGNGVHEFDRGTGQILQSFTTKDGLPHDVTFSVHEDGHGMLWISTSNGLSRFDPEELSFRNFYEQDGLPSSVFYEAWSYQSRSGELFYWGRNGAVSFYPLALGEERKPPEPMLTGLLVNGERILVGDSSMNTTMMMTEEIELSYEENDVVFEYVGLQFQDPEQNRYRYRLSGYDSDWVEAGERRTVRYPNLDPGEYVFHVTAQHSASLWAEPASVRVTVLPPWWRTTWSYMFYGFLFIAGVFAVDRIQRRRVIRNEREKARERQLVQAREIEKAHQELQLAHTELKTTQAQLIQSEKMASLGQLTAGIAHEIKNPLNFVNNFADLNEELARELEAELQANPEKKVAELREQLFDLTGGLKTNARQISKHGKRADDIVKSMMQHASGEGEHYEVAVNPLVDEMINIIYSSLQSQKPDLEVNIEKNLDASAGSLTLSPQGIGKVLQNIVGNAIEAVHEKKRLVDGTYDPRIVVMTRRGNEVVEISVRDNGPGIPQENLQKIFEPFFTTKPTGSGTGLGLSLSYDIVTRGHGGQLEVESVQGEGTTFLISLPFIK